MPRTLAFYVSQSSVTGKLHTALSCPGLERTPVWCTEVDPRCGWQGQGAAAARAGGAPLPRTVTGLVTVTASPMHALAPMTASDLLQSESRPCRLCALELSLDLAATTGPGRTPVAFSGQPAPADEGVQQFDWHEVSATGRARVSRIAERMGLATVGTEVGPVAYGHVNRVTARLLTRNLRSYSLPAELAWCAARAAAGSARADHAVEVYWMLRNHRPPEVHGEDALLGKMANALAR